MVLLRRKDGSKDFHLPFSRYKKSLGNHFVNFWLGLNNMHLFASAEPHELRVELEDWEGNTTYAKYEHFYVNPAHFNYKLSVRGYSGTAGDALASANDMSFTTENSDNDRNQNENCAIISKASWWFNADCFQSVLTGPYSNSPYGGRGLIWSPWKGPDYSLKSCEMKIRPSRG